MALKTFGAGDDEIVRGKDNRADKTIVDLSKSRKKKFRQSTCMLNIGATKKSNFLTLNAKKAFNYLWLAFIKAQILQHFDLEDHIQIETDASGYAIDRVLIQWNIDFNISLNDSNLNKFDFGQWYPIAYFSRKMIPLGT